MKQLTKFCVITLTAISMAGTAFAATPGFYLGAGAGLSKQDTPNEHIFPNSEENTRKLGGIGGRAFAGYNFNEYVGVETGFGQYAPSKYTAMQNGSKVNLRYDMNAIDLVAKGYIPVSDSFNLYGLAGAARVNSKLKYNGSGVFPADSASVTNHKIRPVYGVGASFNIPQSSFTTNLELSRIQGAGDLKRSANAVPSGNMMTLNISYHFN